MSQNASKRLQTVKNENTRLKADISDISDRLETLRKQLEKFDMATNGDPLKIGGKWNLNYGNSTISWAGDEEDGRFEPMKVDWDQLREMYGDDPLLHMLFLEMERFFRHAYTYRPYGGGASYVPSTSVGTVSSNDKWQRVYIGGSSTTSDTNISISDPVTVSYDPTNGTMTMTYDKD